MKAEHLTDHQTGPTGGAAGLQRFLFSMFGQGQVIACPRPLVKVAGGLEAAVMLSQLVYWSDRATLPGGWFAKSYQEIEEETGVEKRAAMKHRAEFERRGWIASQVRKWNGAPVVHYLVNRDALLASIAEAVPASLESAKRNYGKCKTVLSIVQNGTMESAKSALSSIAETTAKNTTETTASAACATAVPGGIPENTTEKGTAPHKAAGSTRGKRDDAPPDQEKATRDTVKAAWDAAFQAEAVGLTGTPEPYLWCAADMAQAKRAGLWTKYTAEELVRRVRAWFAVPVKRRQFFPRRFAVFAARVQDAELLKRAGPGGSGGRVPGGGW